VLQYLRISHKTNIVLHQAKCYKTDYTWGQISKFEVCNSTLKRSIKLIFSEFISMKHILYMRHILYEQILYLKSQSYVLLWEECEKRIYHDGEPRRYIKENISEGKSPYNCTSGSGFRPFKLMFDN
jgi:hypothetical protein